MSTIEGDMVWWKAKCVLTFFEVKSTGFWKKVEGEKSLLYLLQTALTLSEDSKFSFFVLCRDKQLRIKRSDKVKVRINRTGRSYDIVCYKHFHQQPMRATEIAGMAVWICATDLQYTTFSHQRCGSR
ncbi:hypothetical protein H112_08848 [Trichophyton rubrum D6]|uniref:Uncharacterized protein n=3 Tax=Trichophyton TaxID=5550 RepID=F2SCB7_TRIRC|nr:uncharacterized protein TERG_01399 [Trichophyton rubrum CBS 118892]EZF09821.1 hypothetical protein H100_08869 [Trichophyton rubrum MR850]EZF36683.1 hypothetical protein H102_08830 [Trichophyton rubrum CBS 100081]EZF47275.1 hypothetical protein H103_08852 [Trichophyton rubrum CBS 288.86]EZF58013.1 hypothetical protein H104_08800 [Trichophyton rubrum CBS 289.86]EZF68519.1 hypothetical protein H105_08855 [Trichophyton soudanense CBS 452.61]EZF79231.1 hypothetical protein H110_08853 [Trichophy